MKIILHSRAAPATSLRIWAGVFGATGSPALNWSINGQAAAAQVLSPLQSARTPDMVGNHVPRAFTGEFEFQGLLPNRFYRVRCQSSGGSAELETWTLPSEVPSGLDDWFHVLLVSCFHSDEDKSGLAGFVAREIQKAIRPNLSFFLGDQVYLDLPTLQNFRNEVPWLAENFERKYAHNWSNERGLAFALKTAPNAFLSDDHEYWNNFPHPATVIQNSWTAGGRDRWTRAARRLYEAFQLSRPAQLGEAVVIDVPPLSFFVADTRTFRDPDRRFSMTAGAFAQLQTWSQRVKDNKLFGVFVSGQSMFDKPAGFMKGTFADRHLADYGDYQSILQELESVALAGRPVLFVTGDVHWGRTMAGRHRLSGHALAYEVISSPSSLVSTIGKDQLTAIGSGLASLFGRRPRWPRHSDPGKVPEKFKFGQTACNFAPLHGQKGNHLTTLSFNRVGPSLRCMIRYWEIDPERAYIGYGEPVWINLRSEI